MDARDANALDGAVHSDISAPPAIPHGGPGSERWAFGLQMALECQLLRVMRAATSETGMSCTRQHRSLCSTTAALRRVCGRQRRPAYRQDKRFLHRTKRVRHARTEEYEVSFLLQSNLSIRKKQDEVTADKDVERLHGVSGRPLIARLSLCVRVPLQLQRLCSKWIPITRHEVPKKPTSSVL
jgi:hypothetical protein